MPAVSRSIPTKLLALLLALAAAQGAAAEGIEWQNDLEAAKNLAAQTQKLVLLHFWAPWCGPCKQMERTVFTRDDVGTAISAKYVAVKLNTDQHQDLVKEYGVQRIPADVVITPSGQVVDRSQGHLPATAYVARMEQIAASHQPAGPAAGPAVAAQPQPNQSLVGDRYANYGNEPQAPAGNMPPAYQPQISGDTVPVEQPAPVVAQQPQPAPQMPQNGVVSEPAAPPIAQQQPQPQQPAPQVAGVPQPPSPEQIAQFAMEAYCPVRLIESKEWTRGDLRFGAVHRGRTYLFCCPECQKKFLADPDSYAPVAGGMDLVVYKTQQRVVYGNRRSGIFYGQRVILFDSEESLAAFCQNPQDYLPPGFDPGMPAGNQAARQGNPQY